MEQNRPRENKGFRIMDDLELLQDVQEALEAAFNNETDYEALLELQDKFNDFVLKYEDIKNSEKARLEFK